MTPSLNYSDLTISQMVSAWNDLIPAGTAAGLDVTTRKSFTDRPTGIKALQKLSRALDRAAPAASAVPPTAAAPTPEAKAEPVPSAEPTIKATPKTKKKRGYAPDARIELIAATNPKKAGTAAHAAFAHYRTGMLVADFIRAVGSEREANAHLAWDIKHGFIRLT